MAPDDISATARGVNEFVDRVPVLTSIHVHYTLRLPEGAARDKVDRALDTHMSKCPMARSLEGAVAISWTADIVEANG
jgi:uncharacterized OsmC-like protein